MFTKVDHVYTPNGPSSVKSSGIVSSYMPKPVAETVDNFANNGDEDAVRAKKEWQLGTVGSVSSYARLVVMTILASFTWYFLSFALRGLVPGSIPLIIGSFVLRAGLSSLFYGENRGALDPFQTFAVMWSGAVSYGFGIAMFITQIGIGGLAAYVASQLPTILNGGGPVVNVLANPALDTLTGGTVFFVEVMFMTLALYSFLCSYNMKNYWTDMNYNSYIRRGQPPRDQRYMAYDFHTVSTIHAALYALGKGIAYPITGGALDFFEFLWPVIITGIISDYPLWWGYFVASIVAFVLACIFDVVGTLLMNRDTKGINRDNSIPKAV